MKFEHDTVLQEYGVDRKPDIRQFHKLPGIHKEPIINGNTKIVTIQPPTKVDSRNSSSL